MSEKLHPEETHYVEGCLVNPDDDHPVSAAINCVFSLAKCRKRATSIFFEDAPRAWGVWTPEEASEVASRLKVDLKTHNYADPKQSTLSKAVQRILGLID